MDTINSVVSGFGVAFTNTFPGFTMGHVLITAILILILAVVFICALISKSRLNGEIKYENERLLSEIDQSKKELDKRLNDAQRAQDRLKADCDRAISDKDDVIADLNAQLDVLNQFHDKYQAVPDAEKEAARILNDAKNKAFIVANRTEKEYIELIDHANKEAESIRQLAQERLTRSHETLKNAIARANEIVDEARIDAARASGVTYVPEPARIEAPAEPNPGSDE